MHSRRQKGRFIFAIGVSFLTGCGSLQPIADTTRYYTLVPAANATETAAPAKTGAVRVGVRVSVQTDYLRRPPIAVRVAENELRFENDHRWAERVDEGIERALTLALQTHLPNDVVAPLSAGSATGAAVFIDVAVAACEGTGDSALLEGFWKISTASGDPPVSSGHFRRTRAGWDGASYGQLAGLLGELVKDLAAEIALEVKATPSP